MSYYLDSQLYIIIYSPNIKLKESKLVVTLNDSAELNTNKISFGLISDLPESIPHIKVPGNQVEFLGSDDKLISLRELGKCALELNMNLLLKLN